MRITVLLECFAWVWVGAWAYSIGVCLIKNKGVITLSYVSIVVLIVAIMYICIRHGVVIMR